MWKKPSRENLIECYGGSQMWVLLNESNDKDKGVLLTFNGGFQVALSDAARQKLISLLVQEREERK